MGFLLKIFQTREFSLTVPSTGVSWPMELIIVLLGLQLKISPKMLSKPKYSGLRSPSTNVAYVV